MRVSHVCKDVIVNLDCHHDYEHAPVGVLFFRHPPGGAASCDSSDPPSQTIDVGVKIVAVRPPR